MEKDKLNVLVSKIVSIRTHLDLYENDPLLMESFEEYYLQLKNEYGAFLQSLLFDVYDEYCEDNEVAEIEHYFNLEGVEVEAEDVPGVYANLRIKANPLRLELKARHDEFKEIVWAAA